MPPEATPEITPETVRLAYRLLLGREPESERAVASACSYGTLPALRAAFLASPEFRRKMRAPPAPAGSARPVALVEPDAAPIEVEWQVDGPTAAALLAHIGASWTRLGAERPHWSVLSSAQFLPERIGETGQRFFASGRNDRDRLLAVLRRLGRAPDEFPRLFEFGCGLARVTPFLAESFASVDACDVSQSHLALARAHLAGHPRVTLHAATPRDFGMQDGFDLWFSRLVLQHNPPPVMAMVLRRALSLLNPGGIAHFQLPTYARGYRFSVADYLANLPADGGAIEMHVLPQPVVFEIAAQCGCEPLEVWQDRSAGPLADWVSSAVTLRKRGGAARR
jgi:SAM-dependent methyltransferase